MRWKQLNKRLLKIETASFRHCVFFHLSHKISITDYPTEGVGASRV